MEEGLFRGGIIGRVIILLRGPPVIFQLSNSAGKILTVSSLSIPLVQIGE